MAGKKFTNVLQMAEKSVFEAAFEGKKRNLNSKVEVWLVIRYPSLRCDVLEEASSDPTGDSASSSSSSSVRCNIAVTLATAAIVTCFLSMGLR